MNKRRLIRWLRISWAVCCVTATVLLSLLWFRSCWRLDELRIALMGTECSLQSAYGELECDVIELPTPLNVSGWKFYSFDETQIVFLPKSGFYAGFPKKSVFAIVVPHWFVSTFVAALSSLAWLPHRFGTRALLIATTLVAVLLGWACI